jgi:5-hydroxyisourate hydrolase-like protein (transthyretin family)
MGFYKSRPWPYSCGMTIIRLVAIGFVSLCLMLKANAGEAGLTGIVKDTKGQPLAGAEIRIQGSDANKIGRVHTKADGRYSYSELEAGTYQVSLIIDGVTKASIRNVGTKAGENQTLNFELVKSSARPYAAGKHYVWVPMQTGTHLGDWMEVEGDGKGMPIGMQERLNNQGNALARSIQNKDQQGGPTH